MTFFSSKAVTKIAFSGLVLIVLLVFAEVILSWLKIFPSDYYINTPNSGFTWEIDKNEIIGIHQNSEVKFDDLGARSISNYKDKAHKIVVLGGSTTACFALTQHKTWTALLEQQLEKDYWVGNFGRPGNSSNHHVLQINKVLELPELKDAKTVLVMQGVNDFVGYLVSKENYLNYPEDKIERIAFQHLPDGNIPFYKKLTLYKLARRAKQNIIFKLKHKDHLTKTVVDIKTLKQNSEKIDKLPNLERGLNHYENNTRRLIKSAKEKGVKIIFIEQATMWKPNLSPELENLMVTSGFKNNSAFYTTRAFAIGMEEFNMRLKKICNEEKIHFIALDLPKSTKTFYDDFHFNESGAEAISKEIYDDLKELPYMY